MNRPLTGYFFTLVLILLSAHPQLWAVVTKYNQAASVKTLKPYVHNNFRGAEEEAFTHPAWLGATKQDHARFIPIIETAEEEEQEVSSDKEQSPQKDLSSASYHAFAAINSAAGNADTQSSYKYFAYSSSGRYLVFRVIRI